MTRTPSHMLAFGALLCCCGGALAEDAAVAQPAAPSLAGVIAAQDAAVAKFTAAGAFAVPDSPAASLLGDADIGISRPQNVRELTMQLVRYREGKSESPGISLVLAPAQLLFGKRITLADYGSNQWLRQLTRMEFSAGLTDGPTDANTPRRAAVGLSFTPFDSADPRLDLGLKQCFVDALAELKSHPVVFGDNTGIVEAMKKLKTACDPLRPEVLATRQRLGDSLKVGLAKGWATVDAAPGWRDGGWGAWVAGQYNLRRPMKVNSKDAGAGAGADAKASGDLRLLGRLQRTSLNAWDLNSSSWGKRLKSDLTLQLRSTSERADMDFLVEYGSDGSARRLALGIEKKLLPDLWLVLTAGGQSAGSGSTSTQVLGKLKYSLGSDPMLR